MAKVGQVAKVNLYINSTTVAEECNISRRWLHAMLRKLNIARHREIGVRGLRKIRNLIGAVTRDVVEILQAECGSNFYVP